jgi:hypothetical protein
LLILQSDEFLIRTTELDSGVPDGGADDPLTNVTVPDAPTAWLLSQPFKLQSVTVTTCRGSVVCEVNEATFVVGVAESIPSSAKTDF